VTIKPVYPFALADNSAELIDSPLVRRAGGDVLSLALMDARNHTLQLFGQYQNALEAVDFRVPKAAGLEPPLWKLGHVGWFQEWWIGRNLQRALGPRCPPDGVRLPSIQARSDYWFNPYAVPPASRWALDLPDVAACRTYLLETLESTLELLDRAGDGDDALYFYRLCLLHEDLQGESFVCMAQALGLPLSRPMQAAFAPAPMALREPLLVPATSSQMGSPAGAGTGFAFDNEQPAHAVSVPEFEIDAQAVTWAQYMEFVGDGGYDRAELWHPDGWRWLQALAASEGRRGPRHVEQIGASSGAVVQNRFGQPVRMQAHQPAMHVSWWEADAWCRWAGRRLPTEAEWEVAARTASRRGFRWGDVWEWMGTTFRPYPGFVPGPAQEYSQACFGTHRVLRGASFASRARMKHPNFRSFQRPERDDAFCGFRSCAL